MDSGESERSGESGGDNNGGGGGGGDAPLFLSAVPTTAAAAASSLFFCFWYEVDSLLNLPTALSAITEALNETCSEQQQRNKSNQNSATTSHTE
jgi:hypothetical protein